MKKFILYLFLITPLLTQIIEADKKTKKDLTQENEDSRKITNNNVFVGSTTDLQRMLLNKEKVIDAESQEQ